MQRVEWLRDRIRDGLAHRRGSPGARRGGSAALDEPAELRDALIASIRDYEPQVLSATLDQAFAVLPLEQALTEVVTPALRWAGEAWHRGELSIAQEHAITAKVRAHLGKLLSDGRGGVHGVAVLACAPGEQHDIGLLMLAVMLRADGWRVEFLGADTPVDTAIAFADRIGATMLCISAARSESVELLRLALAADDRRPTAALVVGGAAIDPADRPASSERPTPTASSTSPSRGCASWRSRSRMSPWLQAGLAGGAAAAVWGLVEPIDQRLFRFPYSDIAILGKLATRGPHWRAVGWAMHVVNGVFAGLVFWALYEWLGGNAFWFAVGFAMVEHLVTYPLTMLDRPVPPGPRRTRVAADVAVGPRVRSGDLPPPRCSASSSACSCRSDASERPDSGMRRRAMRKAAEHGDDPVAHPLSEAAREPVPGALELRVVVEDVRPRRPCMREARRPHEPDERYENRRQADERLALEEADQGEQRVARRSTRARRSGCDRRRCRCAGRRAP